jgi:muconolactone delta-isomerase
MDAVTADLNRYIADQDDADALETWRAEEAAQIQDAILSGEDNQFWDLGSECTDALCSALEDDEQQDLIRLVVAAMDAGDDKMRACARRYYKIIEAAAAKMADSDAKHMEPSRDED